MPEHTPHQKKIIQRYYQHRHGILLGRLAEIVTELALADTDKKRDRLWRRAEQAMRAMEVPVATLERILRQRDAAVLARHLRSWIDRAAP
jgi:hypothetical protein